MRMLLSLAVVCFAIHSGMGVPLGRYMFVRCHPWLTSSNCVTHIGPKMKLSADLPVQLPASATQYLDAQPVEEAWPVRKQTVESVMFSTEDGSGEGSAVLEGSAVETPMVEGSGDYWTPQDETAKADFHPVEEERSDDQLLDP